jgi:hypothetical protein
MPANSIDSSKHSIELKGRHDSFVGRRIFGALALLAVAVRDSDAMHDSVGAADDEERPVQSLAGALAQ